MRHAVHISGLVAALIVSAHAQAPQAPPPVKWSLTLAPNTRVVPNAIFAALVTAQIDPGWHLYAMAQPDGGPIATTIAVPGGQVFQLAGKVAEPAPRKSIDRNFGDLVTLYFENIATFTLPVRVVAKTPTGPSVLRVEVEYQICSDRLCLKPTTVELAAEVPINGPLPPKAIDPANPDQPSLSVAVAARSIADPTAKLQALAKVREEFKDKPHWPEFFRFIDEATLTTLYRNFPERTTEISNAFERVLQTMSPLTKPEDRLGNLLNFSFQQNVVRELTDRQLLLPRLEQVLLEAVKAAGIDFESQRAVALFRLGEIAVARHDTALADARFREALRTAPDHEDAAKEVIAYFVAHGRAGDAERATRDLIRTFPGKDATCAAAVLLADEATRGGRVDVAERWLKDAVATFPLKGTRAPGRGVARAMLALAHLEESRGANASALDRYMLVAATQETWITGVEILETMRGLYRKVHGRDAGLEAALDAISRPMNPVKVTAYKPTPARTTKTVLVEEFTGTGCGPCVGGDLALDAVRGRYAPDDVVVLSYHQSVPPPDPLVVSGGNGRATFYRVSGTPMFPIDGVIDPVKANGYGGHREDAPWMSDWLVEDIDKALEQQPGAQVAVRGVVSGDTVRATATVGKLPARTDGLRLYVVLAEREVKYGAENGIRLHPMVVRAVSGNQGSGVPISANGSFEYTFSVSEIKDDILRTLAAEVQERRENRARRGSEPRQFFAENHDVTNIDPSNLVIVAFVQGADKKVLQAAQSPVIVTRDVTVGGRR